MSLPMYAGQHVRTFTLRDAEGESHSYEVTLHRATLGQPIMWEILALLSGPLAGLLGLLVPILDSMAGKKIAEVMDDPAALSKLVDGLRGADLNAVGAGLKAALGDPKNTALVGRILGQTTRDGKDLANPVEFDAAFTANYLELAYAVWEVVSANRFLPLPGTR